MLCVTFVDLRDKTDTISFNFAFECASSELLLFMLGIIICSYILLQQLHGGCVIL